MADKNIFKGWGKRGKTLFEFDFFSNLAISLNVLFVEIEEKTSGKILHFPLGENKDLRVTAGTWRRNIDCLYLLFADCCVENWAAYKERNRTNESNKARHVQKPAS